MKKLALAAMLATLPALAMAQTTQPPQRDNANRTDSQRGASSYTLGQQMQERGSKAGQSGASGYAPGQKMQEKGSVRGKPGASDYAPGTKAKQR